SGKPVVAAAHGGVLELVVDGVTGILVPPRDPAALANAVSNLLSDAELRERMGAAGRHRVQTSFSPTVFREGYLRVYRDLVSN
ncbi:MAG TPA: glycosyltransferase family 4 protein, partial [Gemmatimonadaceae bacterium]